MFADIILPLAIDAPTYTYSVPEEFLPDLRVGVRVIVRLGHKKFYSGIVHKLHNTRPDFKKIRPIESVVDRAPVVTPEQLRLWEWIASYYMSSMGMVMRAALPAGLKLDGFSHTDTINDGYAPRKTSHLTLHPSIRNEHDLHAAFESLKRAKAQYAALIGYVDLAGKIDFCSPPTIARNRLKASAAIIKALTDKNILALTEVEAEGDTSTDDIAPLPQLTPAQNYAMQEIVKNFESKDIALLHGVTGSGKTEIYIHFISDALKAGKNVLYMLPEIALTAQLINRLEEYFGDRVIISHSRLTDNRRAAIYHRLLNAQGKEQRGLLIVGVRSSVLLPTPGLSLIVIDEEHDSSFKQSDTSPRYHARDTAIMLANFYGAKIILGSATPCVESYFNAVSGKKYGYVTLSERFGDVQMPRIVISDILRAAKRGEKTSHFTHLLIQRMDDALKNEQQIILFQNRRGFSPYVECGSCGWTATCPQCNVSLTYHKSAGALKCHYCGYNAPIPRVCPSCKTGDIFPKGFGTEKVEEELFTIFPDARIERLDGDTARSPKNYHRIIKSFEKGETDILVGTQMITKGFDFGNVSLVGVLNADNLLNYPDFRASERAFQLMVQVAGRAGRRDTQGTVIIQTAQPTHQVLKYVLDYDYESLVRSQLSERLSFTYPPYCRLISVSMYHRDHDLLWRGARYFEGESRKVFGKRLLGPEPPPVDKIKNEYIVRFILKIERESSFSRAKTLLSGLLKKMSAQQDFRNVGIKIDVDPQ